MKRIILILTLLLPTAFSAFAQVEEEIQQSKAERIAKGRAYLLEKFLDRDYDKVREIKDYLLTLEDDNYVALRPMELWIVELWTKEYDALVSSLRQVDSTFNARYTSNYYSYSRQHEKISPLLDDLTTKLFLRTREDEHLLRFGLQEANLPPEDDAFLSMFMDWLFVEKHYLVMDTQNDANQTKLNVAATKFLTDYPNSDYEWFVRHLMRKQYSEKDWGFGVGVDFRSALTTGTLANRGLGVGISFDVLYKRFDLTVGFGAMNLKTREDQVYGFQGNDGLVYPKGSNCNWNTPYANLAYYLFDGKRIAVGPMVGVGWFFEDYPYNDKKEEEYKELNKNFLVCKVGVNFDFKVPYYGFDRSAIRVKYEFGLTGFGAEQLSTVHMLSVGISFIGRGTKRVY